MTALTGDEETRAFVQRRLALFTKLWFCMLPLFVLSVMGLYAIYPHLRPRDAGVVHVVAAATLVPLAGVWYLCLHRRRSPLRVLYLVDIANLTITGALFAFSAYVSSDLRAAVYTTFIWHTFVVLGRVFVVPSSARRTAAVTATSYLPMIVAAALLAARHPERIELPAPAFVIAGCLFIAAAVFLATAGSHVIYGLRRQVDHARRIGQYELDAKIGEGGMGVVYRARHAMLRRPTAIKLLPRSKASAESLARFEREVQQTSRLTHPNTVAVFDYGRSLDGVFYYAMEYVDGVDLETLVRTDGPMPAARAVRILRQVCGSLAEAHALGLVHRDVKPANLMLCRRGGQPDVVKVLDFGLVQEVADGTARGVVGTPSYMAPEAVTDPARVGAAADLYALGAVAYFLLTGQRVFDGEPGDVCIRHVTTAPVPPSRRTDRPIPDALERIVLMCLEKAPAARPASARALDDALASVPLDPPWTDADAEAWWARFAEGRAAAAPPTLTATVEVDLARWTDEVL